jgi:hypothetical protein
MAWARYDDELPMNKKVGALLADRVWGVAALGLHVLANTWSRHNGTAGMIPRHTPGQLVHDAKIGKRLADMLTTVGMFDIADGGWMIHDFDVYSDPNDDGRSAAEKKRDISAKRSAAGREGGLAKAKQTSGKSLALPEQTSGPVPVPVPDPVPLVQVSDIPTSETTGPAGDNSDRRASALALYAAAELAKAKARGEVRSDVKYTAAARETGSRHPDLDRWLTEWPTAPSSAVAGWLAGDKHSMAYYDRVDPDDDSPVAAVIQLRGESA